MQEWVHTLMFQGTVCEGVYVVVCTHVGVGG